MTWQPSDEQVEVGAEAVWLWDEGTYQDHVLPWNLCCDRYSGTADRYRDMFRAGIIAAHAVQPPVDVDSMYRERDQVVAALSKCFPSWLGPVDDAEPGWTSAVYIELPAGQASWHIPDEEAGTLFAHLQFRSDRPWDGHTTPEKYARLNALKTPPPACQKRRPAECFPVEDYVRDEMEARGWTVADLAERMGLPESLVQDDLDRGFIGVWPYALSRAFGNSFQFWMRVESAYKGWCAWKGIER